MNKKVEPEAHDFKYKTREFSKSGLKLTTTVKAFNIVEEDDFFTGHYYYTIMYGEHIVATGSGTSNFECPEREMEEILDRRLKTLEF